MPLACATYYIPKRWQAGRILFSPSTARPCSFMAAFGTATTAEPGACPRPTPTIGLPRLQRTEVEMQDKSQSLRPKGGTCSSFGSVRPKRQTCQCASIDWLRRFARSENRLLSLCDLLAHEVTKCTLVGLDHQPCRPIADASRTLR